MRFGISLKILPGVRVGASFGGRRKARLWAAQRLGRHVSITESTSGRRKPRRRT